MFAAIFWDPDPVFFRIPFLGHPIVWYGVLFAAGFFVGYFVTRGAVERHLRATCAACPEGGFRKAAGHFTDRLLWMCVVGVVVGARLSHVFFYEWPYYSEHLLDIPKVWIGGLSSHGAAVGVMLALILFHRKARKDFPTFTFLNLFDVVVLPTAMIAVFIRVGNFINQELIGVPTSAPWAVVFGRAADGSVPEPRHPVQLYEATIYGAIFLWLALLNRTRVARGYPGIIAGQFLLFVFGARIWLETYKIHLSQLISREFFLSMGQLLSFPLVITGLSLTVWSLIIGNRQRLPHYEESGR